MSDSETIPQKAPPSDSEASESATTAPRSRSQSRRARRRKQQSAKKISKQNMPAVKEEDQDDEADKAMQPFNYIGPDETSMDGPVTYARAQRGEIPMREGNPKQALATGKGDKQGGGSKMMDQDGLKLKLELNLDVEIELKASIRGDLTLALL